MSQLSFSWNIMWELFNWTSRTYWDSTISLPRRRFSYRWTYKTKLRQVRPINQDTSSSRHYFRINKREAKVNYCLSSCHNYNCSSIIKWWTASPPTHLRMTKALSVKQENYHIILFKL
jgi:hypothetical protein